MDNRKGSYLLTRVLVATLLLLPAPAAFSAIEIRWLGVASFLISDGESTILLDPAWTRPRLPHWIGLKEFRSDETLVDTVLAKIGVTQLSAVLVTHSHFDHIVDAAYVAHKTHATFYTDQNFERIARANDWPDLVTAHFGVNESFDVGRFRITAYQRDHLPLIRNIDFLPGDVPEDFNFNFWDYRAGRTWVYLIEHPEGKILVHVPHAAEQDLKNYRPDVTAVDILIQGVTKDDTRPLVNGYVDSLKPSVFIASHFDNFLAKFDLEETAYLSSIDLDEVAADVKAAYPLLEIVEPALWGAMKWENGVFYRAAPL